jgi:hypothetical protein
MNVHNAQAATQNLKSDTFNITAVNSPTYTVKSGYIGAVGKYLKTGWIPNDSSIFTLASSCTHFQMFQIPTATAVNIFGCSTSVTAKLFLTTYTTSADRYYLMANAYVGQQNIQNDNFYSYNTNGTVAGANESYENAINKGTVATSHVTRPTVEMVLCGINNNGSYSGTATGMSNWMAGSYMTEAETTSLYNIMAYFNANVGGTF